MAKIEKTSKPSRIEFNREWSGPNGMVYYFDIEFEDESVGQFSTKKREQTKFTVGKEVTITAEDKTNQRGPYVFFDLAKPKPGEPGSGGTGSGRNPGGNHMSPEIEASITASVCLDQAAVIISKTGMAEQVKPDLMALHVLANKLFNHIMDKSKGDRQLSINYQSRLKEVTNILMDWKKPDGKSVLDIKNSNDVLKYVDLEVEYLQSKMKAAAK
jgi:hypothetical protein